MGIVEELRRQDTQESWRLWGGRTAESEIAEGKRLQKATSPSCWNSCRVLPSYPEWLKAEELGTESSEI